MTATSAADPDSDSDSVLPRWFGDYILLKRLARGGMGQVHLARLPGLQGIDRLCVIKTLRAQWTNDREYVARFVDEARVVVQLAHKNICPVFDVGQVKRSYYLAMDLVTGRDLQAVLQRATTTGRRLPIDVVLHICAEVLEALDAAHRLTHPLDDTPLNLVHRDVSPHNVLVSFDGDVKLIDFGLAQSALKNEQTEPGVVLGKLAYMAPEHARGEDLDRRADIFAVGVVLYELAIGRRFWEGRSVADIWSVVGAGTHVASGLDELDADIRAIVRKATAARPADRHATAAAMRQQIVQAQIARGVVAGSAELRTLLGELFPGEAAADRRERAALSALAPPTPTGDGSTRIAAAPGRATPLEESPSPSLPSPSPSSPLLAGPASSLSEDDLPTLNELAGSPSSTESDRSAVAAAPASARAQANAVREARARAAQPPERDPRAAIDNDDDVQATATALLPRRSAGAVVDAPLPAAIDPGQRRSRTVLLAAAAVLGVAAVVAVVVPFDSDAAGTAAPVTLATSVTSTPLITRPVTPEPTPSLPPLTAPELEPAPLTPETPTAQTATPETLTPETAAKKKTTTTKKRPPLPTPLPRPLEERLRLLKSSCVGVVSCAGPLLERAPTRAKLTPEDGLAFSLSVSGCLQECATAAR